MNLRDVSIIARLTYPCAVCWRFLLSSRVTWANWLSAGDIAGSDGTDPPSTYVTMLYLGGHLFRRLPWFWIAFSSSLSTLDTVELSILHVEPLVRILSCFDLSFGFCVFFLNLCFLVVSLNEL